jgi:hypothetical protein
MSVTRRSRCGATPKAHSGPSNPVEAVGTDSSRNAMDCGWSTLGACTRHARRPHPPSLIRARTGVTCGPWEPLQPVDIASR